jgi:hypothetical protein
MSTLDLSPDHAPPARRGPSLDRLNIASLAWTCAFAIVTAVLAVVLR